jgi:hypothetical protein
MKPTYEVADYLPAKEWITQKGGAVFKTNSSLEWFVRQHREALLASGELIPQSGPRGNLLGPKFGQVAAELLRKART